jgi:phosphatidylinositol alpha-1,6-mannosyltransferase
MKLAFLTPCYPPPLEGGSIVFLYNLISNLPPEDVVVFTNARPGQEGFDAIQPYRIWRSGTLWRDFRKLGKLWVFAEWLVRFSFRLRREKADLLHAGDLFYSGTIVWLQSRLSNTPYVVYVYAEELAGEIRASGGLWSALRSALYRRVLRDADGIVGVSDYTLSLLPFFGVAPEKAIKIVPMVAPVPEISTRDIEDLRARYGVAARERVVLAVGRLIERKGFDNLIRAYSQVRATIPEVRLVIAGRGPEAPRLTALVEELGLGGFVIFAGFVPESELTVLFEMCEVFAMPHRELPNGDTEGCPTVFLEAGVHGKPVVGGRAGGVADAILAGETGLVVDGGSPKEIADALLALLSNTALARRLGERGRQRVLEELSPRNGAERLLEFSRRILREKRNV